MSTSDFLTLEEVVAIHNDLVAEFGGPHGLRDPAALESAVMRPRMGYYDSILEEASALMESLAMNHPFVDGNKRASFFATATFLRLNGLRIVCDDRETHRLFMQLLEARTFDHRQHLICLEAPAEPL